MYEICQSIKNQKRCNCPSICVPAEIIFNVQALQSLTVDRSMEQEKQKSEVKHILQQKQRALADLFKMLAQIGQSESLHLVLETLFRNIMEISCHVMENMKIVLRCSTYYLFSFY